jgi:ribosomal protein S27E
MNIKQYLKNAEEGFTASEIRRGLHTTYIDVTCPHCGKEQTVAQTGYIGGPCCRCGGYTDGRPGGEYVCY